MKEQNTTTKPLPEGWKWVRLGEVVEKKKFAIVDGPFGTQLHADEYLKDGEIPVIRVINLSYKGEFNKKDLVYIAKNKANILKRSKVISGDIIIAKTGATIGKSAKFPHLFSEGIIASSCMKMSIDKNIGNNDFILYWIVSDFGQNAIINSALGTTRTTININPFKNISFPLPPLPEQQKIAEILETVDNAIEKTDRIIEKYKRIKQGMMHDLLTRGIDEHGNIRSEKTHRFKDSPLGRIPEEWEVKRLGEISLIIMGQSPPSLLVNKEGKGFPFLQGNAEFTIKYPSPINWIEKPSRMSIKGSILVSVRAPIGDLNLSEKEYCIGRGLASIKPNGDILSICFAWYILKFYIKDLTKIGQGSTFEAVNKEDLKNFVIPLPPPDEQKRIAEILSQIDQTIEKEEAYKQKLERIKQGLMEDLLTGKVGVNHLIEHRQHRS